jgi:hypothetical protein
MVGALGTGLVEIGRSRLEHAPSPSAASAAAMGLLILGVAVLAGMVSARRPAVHFVGYALYGVALALGLGYGTMRAVVNTEGGLEGEPSGPLWITVVLVAGALLCVLCLLALVVQIVVELRGASAGEGARR